MQRDFVEPGGFGETLGNDVTRLQAIIPATAALIAGFRKAGLTIVHTRECHRPDLADCPPPRRIAAIRSSASAIPARWAAS